MTVTANSLITPQTVVSAVATCTAAKTTYNDTTNAVRLVQASDNVNGALVKKLHAIPRGTCSATQLQVYRSYNSGTTLSLADSALLSAYTMSGSTAITKADFGLTSDEPMRLKAGEELWVAIGATLSAGIDFVVEFEAF